MSPAPSIMWEDAYAAVGPLINAEGLLRWPFDPLLPVDVRFYTYDRRRDFRLCRHDYFEIFYLYSGNLTFQLSERRLPMKRGDLIVLNSTHYHKIHASGGRGQASSIQGVLLYFLPQVLRDAVSSGENSEYLVPFLQQDDSFPHVIPAESGIPAAVYKFMRMISAELPAATSRSRLSVKTYVKMILINLVNHYAAYGVDDEAFSRKQRSIERLRPLFAFLDEHYSEAISLDQAAGLVHMSKSHFLHFMKQVTGLSFVSYLNQFRVAKAQELLIKSDKSIAEIGQGVGFCDQSYFGNVFRKLLHMSPSQYRLQGELPAAYPVSTSHPSSRLRSQAPFSILTGGRDSVRK